MNSSSRQSPRGRFWFPLPLRERVRERGASVGWRPESEEPLPLPPPSRGGGAIAIALAAWIVTASAHAAPTGLDALDDEALRNQLAARDLTGLLDRAFDLDHTPKPQRDALVARTALLRLKDDKGVDLTTARRRVAQYVAALDTILAATKDPAALIGDANLLIDQGVAPDQSLLEYFGPTPAAMNRLRPVAVAVRKLLDLAGKNADALCTVATNDWPAMEPVWDLADRQKTIAGYTRAIVAYPLALATDPADDTRDKTITEAIVYLQQFDTPDNPDASSVKFYLAKLNLVRATPESLTAAVNGFAFATQRGRADDVRQQFDARLLTASANLLQHRITDADAAIDDLLRWSRQAGLDTAQIDVAVAGARYREALAAGKFAQADGVLDDLLRKHADLRGLVLELIAARTDGTTPITLLSPLSLQALLARGETETLKPAGQPFDRAAVERGIDAARELLHRNDIADARLLDNTAYVLPFYLQKLDRRLASAAAFLDYVDAYKAAGKSERLSNAFDQAVAIVADLFRQTPDDPAVTKLYDRTLATAVTPPLDRSAFAYEYARRLQATGKTDDAVAAFGRVPADDRNYGESRYYLMVALGQRLDATKAGDPARPAALTELSRLIDTVDRTTQDRLKAEPTPQATTTDRTRLAQTRLLGADVALRDQQDANRAVTLLTDFEAAVAGLGNEAGLLGEALLVRVQAYVQLGDVGHATDQLVALAKRDPAGAGQVVYNLLKKLDEQITAAEAAHRDADVGRLEGDRALLTPFLVTWAEHHADLRIRKLTYTYRVFDADTQRRAALTTADAAERARLLDAALQRFLDLDSATTVQDYLNSLPPADRAALHYDPQVKLGLARTLFARGDWAAARQQLATLFRDKAVGDGFLTEADAAGNFQSRENPSYWEALLDLIRSNLNLHENVDGMKGLLAEQTALYGDDLGGKRWKAGFVKLQSDLAAGDAATRPG